MKTTWNTHPDDARTYDSERLRDTFLTESLFTLAKFMWCTAISTG
ncbi:hypothetical protein ABC733_12925 [Mangrovibacter sp. SLW1]